MRFLFCCLIAATLATAPVSGQEPEGLTEAQQLNLAYKKRLRDRRAYALDTRRRMNAGKVHRYRTAIAVSYDPVGRMALGGAIERQHQVSLELARSRRWYWPTPPAPRTYIPRPYIAPVPKL